MFSCTYIYIRI